MKQRTVQVWSVIVAVMVLLSLFLVTASQFVYASDAKDDFSKLDSICANNKVAMTLPDNKCSRETQISSTLINSGLSERTAKYDAYILSEGFSVMLRKCIGFVLRNVISNTAVGVSADGVIMLC